MWAGALARAKITRVPVTLTGPSPYARDGQLHPLGFCAVCAAAFKAAAFERQGTAVQAADKDPDPSTIRLLATEPAPALAVAYGLASLPGPPGSPAAGQPILVPLPLCWTHLAAVKFTSSGIIAAPGPILLDGSSRPPHP